MRSIYAQAKRQGSLWKVCSSQVSSARSHKNSWERSFHWQGNNHNKKQFKERKGAKKWWFAADLLQNAQETNVLRRKNSLKSQSGLRGRGRDKKVRWNKGKERAISWFWEYKICEHQKKKMENMEVTNCSETIGLYNTTIIIIIIIIIILYRHQWKSWKGNGKRMKWGRKKLEWKHAY